MSVCDFYSHAREGRDLARMKHWVEGKDFYSHAREGRDSQHVIVLCPLGNISTHTPARGVTRKFPI